MAFSIDFTDQTGTTGIAHKELLLRIQALAELNGWTTLRYATGVAPTVGTGLQDELILQGEGLAGTDEIFIGFRTYDNVSADYYNISVAGFTGYVPGNPWSAQPGIIESGIPAHNQRVDYWLQVNARRINLALKIGTPVYTSGGAGFFLPYSLPSQYPYPMYVAGMLNGPALTRYSDTAMSMPWKGNRPNFRIRWFDGSWKQPDMYPWNNAWVAGATSQLRDTNDQYPVMRIRINDAEPNVYGVLDGIGYVSNFNNTVESTVSADGDDWVCIQDVGRTSFNDYFALRLA
ncbi:hypothetical protein [Marilutibacter alkalisoli]|uniref:Virion structural protein n=1 Tax=Marilutibacter alkalisoli TaxID=2591633 RepID=A0A514BTZ1_9GAMM|nr:hypothetical protein [Lysobacter alkalisoli]QDH70842.1 hypothetical protein FKV23_12685 [Lysobacter alkalisoli]